jgi:hypothetical protein
MAKWKRRRGARHSILEQKKTPGNAPTPGAEKKLTKGHIFYRMFFRQPKKWTY